MLGAALPAGATGPGVGIEVAAAGSGQVLYSANAGTPATPASTTKIVTAVTALAALGPDARFSTTVRLAGDTVVLAGGGDPTLAVNGYPSSDYPRPATLAQLAAGTARALKAQGRLSVRLGYDTALYSGPDMAQGWTNALISTGNVTPDRRPRGRPGPAGARRRARRRRRRPQLPPADHRPGRPDRRGVRGPARARRDHGHRPAGGERGPRIRSGARHGQLAAARRDRRPDAARVQQRDRGEPGQARGDRPRPARHVHRRRPRGAGRVATARHHDTGQPGRRQRLVACRTR